MDEKAINNYLLEESIFALFCRQLHKDFQGAGVDVELLAGVNTKPSLTREVVLEAVRKISGQGSQLLPRLLYRIDISEKTLSDFAAKHQALSFEEVVAELIVRRVLQKVILKKRFSDG